MKKVLLLVLMFLILSPVGAVERQLRYEDVKSNDEGVYIFFSSLAKLSNEVLELVVEEGNATSKFELLDTIVNKTLWELPYYRSIGVGARIEKFLKPFIKMRDGLRDVKTGQAEFFRWYNVLKKSRSFSAYSKAASALILMKNGRDTIVEASKEIKSLNFIMENGSVKRIDVNFEDNIERLDRLIDYYSRLLERLKVPEGFFVNVSKLNPYATEPVIIYGAGEGLKNIILYVGNESFDVGSPFSITYSFPRPGVYEVYATAVNGSRLVKSNIIVVNVTKMPTKIVVEKRVYGYVSTPLVLSGSLVDALSRPLANRTLLVISSGEETYVITDVNGVFRKIYSLDSLGTINVRILFEGDDVYENSSASVTLVFLRLPVTLKIEGEEKARIGSTYRVYGEALGLRNGTLLIYVDNRTHGSVNVRNSKFTFNLTFEVPGTHEIFVAFPGDNTHAPAKSNVLVVKVYVPPYAEVAGFILLLILMYAVFRITKRKRSKKKITLHDIIAGVEEREEEKRSVREAYRWLYKRLISQYGLKPSITPRELYRFLSKERFAPYLRKVTAIHEVHVYGMRRLPSKTVKDFFRSLSVLIISKIIGEEL
ncbi:hypothetical protein [Pyrococcus sp. ST04]|uniref:hypothetical protein n=1 Tax=Pyrococcus sp. ST04 TaxID=1183377 RepID=UPI0002605AB8|nr:hypothetical protein [Pyrococcus sp. ST04]AFK22120.1 hypothetical protein Py04_0519 [Pyrococcus sp. ST04]